MKKFVPWTLPSRGVGAKIRFPVDISRSPDGDNNLIEAKEVRQIERRHAASEFLVSLPY